MSDQRNDDATANLSEAAEEAIGGIAPSRDDETSTPPVRDGLDASDSEQLRRNPSNEDAKLDIGLDETFPGSDAPSNIQPGKGKDPAPSTGFDPEAEARLTR
jgi:hypothetical protein